MTVFIFTDLESSTRLWQQFPQQMGAVIAHHDHLLTALIEQSGGQVVKNTGDGLFAVFENGDPLTCALDIQKEMARQVWGPVGELRVRIALHSGKAIRQGNDYFGLDINRTARLLTAGWGGQILLSGELAGSAPLPPGAGFRDLGVHLLKDLSEPLQIFELAHPDLPVQRFPALRTLSAHPHNLPAQSTPFVGRGAELAEITGRLSESTCRLLTLVGPGGMGKTRLALQAAAGQIESFGHGVFFVPLTPLESGEFLVPAIAEALRFTFYQRDQPRRQLLDYLRGKNILLVMDNFEHLVESAGLVSEMLAAAPRLQVLATSRERLNLTEEQIIPVEGMRFPELDSIKNLDEYSALKLFVQSGQRARPGYELVPDEWNCAARICRLVQGTPLGIELAAGWLRSLSCREIAAEIQASLDFLETGLRNTPDRHRSLRAVFDYSWTLLPKAEREILMRLAVFQGAFRRKAADAVLTRALNLPRQALLTQLTALVDKSLLRNNTNGTYELHSAVHHYALEHLKADPHVEQHTRDAHAAYFGAFLAENGAALHGSSQPAAMKQIVACLDDIRAGWLWQISQDKFQAADAAIDDLYAFFDMQSLEEESLRLFGEARERLAHSRSEGAEQITLRVTMRYARSCAFLGRMDKARALQQAGMETARRLNLPSEIALAFTIRARIAWVEGDYANAIHSDQQALEIYRHLQAQKEIAGCLDRLGVSAWSMGNYDRAREFMLESRELIRSTGAPTEIAHVLDHLGVVTRDSGDLAAAQLYFEESRAILDGVQARGQLAFVVNHLAGIATLTGHADKAVAQFEQSIALAREIGSQRAVAYNLFDLGEVQREYLGKPLRAGELYAESLALFESLGERFGMNMARVGIAKVDFETGNPALGLGKLELSLREAVEMENERLIGNVLFAYAQFLNRQARFAEALHVLVFLSEKINRGGGGSQEEDALLDQVKLGLSDSEIEAGLARGSEMEIEMLIARLENERVV